MIPEQAGPRSVRDARSKPRVALVEDQLAVAQALSHLLSATPGLVFVGHAASERALVELLATGPADVLLIDIDGRPATDIATDARPPTDARGTSALDVADRLARRWPDSRLVVLAGVHDERLLADAVRIGVLGWVPKTADPADLVAAVHGALRGETHVPPDLLTGALRRIVAAGTAAPAAPPGNPLDRLTPRERDVLDAMAQGRSRSDVARWLGMSPHTVRTHVQNILRTLGVDSAAAAVAVARHRADPVPDTATRTDRSDRPG